jgi:hypothetical protein
MDAEGHLTQQTAGNGLVTSRSFSATTGRPAAPTGGGGGGGGLGGMGGPKLGPFNPNRDFLK